jgi:hypothetical protein
LVRLGYASCISCYVALRDGDKLTSRCIGVAELKNRHTAEEIEMVFANLLSDFGLEPKHVYIVVTDNGSNIVKPLKGGKLSLKFNFLEAEEASIGDDANEFDDSDLGC